MKPIIVLSFLIFLTGCASQQSVNCDWRLKPINASAATAKAAPYSKPEASKKNTGSTP